MRFLSLVIVLAACSSNSSSSPDATTPPGSPDATTSDGSTALTCGASIATDCSANHCDQTLSAAEQDKTLCPASLMVCGGYTVITQIGVDTSTRLYYMDDQLVAITHTLAPRPPSCTAGPSMFSPPSCSPGGTQLPACSP